jgi:hypothetical protein
MSGVWNMFDRANSLLSPAIASKVLASWGARALKGLAPAGGGAHAGGAPGGAAAAPVAGARSGGVAAAAAGGAGAAKRAGKARGVASPPRASPGSDPAARR